MSQTNDKKIHTLALTFARACAPKRGVDYWTDEDKNAIVQELSPPPLPSYWEQHLSKRIADIQNLHKNGGSDCFSFALIGDMHYDQNLGKRSPLLARRIMDACSIKYALLSGDFQSRGGWSTKEQALAEWNGIHTMCQPLEGRMLTMRGNHDGAWGTSIDGVDYPYNFPSGEIDAHVYRPCRMMDGIVFDSQSSAYYVDHHADRVRYLMLNAFCNPDERTDNGTHMHNSMRKFRFTQPQFDFVKQACNSMQEGWSLVVACHVPVSNAYGSFFNGTNETDTPSDTAVGDHTVMRGLLMAYRNKIAYSGGWEGTLGYDKVSVTADFSDAKGDFVAFFATHAHRDLHYSHEDFGIDIVTTRCDGACENLGSLLAERAPNTVTEQCFDVFTVNRKTGYMYATRIGAGSDRGFAYRNIQTHAISYDLAYVSSDNATASIIHGASFQTTLSAADGYMLDTVRVTMAGKDITETAYQSGVVSIAQVMGDVEILAHGTVIPPSWTNALPSALAAVDSSTVYNGKGYKNGVYPSGQSGSISEGTDAAIVYSGYIPFSVPLNQPENSQVIYMKGITFNSGNSHHRIVTWSAGASANNPYLEGNNIWTRYFTVEELGTNYYKLTPIHDAYTSARGTVTHIRISATGVGENWIISVNNPIE